MTRMVEVAVHSDGLHTLPGGQTEFWNDWSHDRLFLSGGWNSGKTWIGARKLLALHLFNSYTDAGTLTNVNSAAVGPTYQSIADYMLPAMTEACQEWNIQFLWHGQSRRLYLPQFENAVLCRTADAPGTIAGWKVGAAWGDEPARWKQDYANPLRDSYIQLLGRVRDSRARKRMSIFTGTHEGEATRFYREIQAGGPRIAAYRAKTAANPTATEFIETQRSMLSPEMVEQYLDGGVMTLGGNRAYASSFTEANIAECSPNHSLPIAMAIDFNIRPGMHALIGQYDGTTDRFYVFDELHRFALTVRDMIASDLVRSLFLIGLPKPAEIEVYGDPSGSARNVTDGATDYDVVTECLDAAGFRRSIRVASRDPGQVNRVNAACVALRDARGETHVTIHPRCKRLIRDLREVQWLPNGDGLDKRTPELTHLSDALCYWVDFCRGVRRIVATKPGRYSVTV